MSAEKKGETLCFLHGWGFDGRALEKFCDGFTPEWNVKIPVLPGYDGAAPEALGIEHVARALLPEVPDNSVLVGWSLGGMIAIRMASMKPLKKLVLLASAPCFVGKQDWPYGMSEELIEGLQRRVQENPGQALQEFALLSSKGDKNPRATYRSLTASLQRAAVHRAALLDGLEMLRNADLRPEFSGLKCRVGAILAENDQLFSASCARAMLSLNPDLELSTMGGCGHAPFISRPEQSRRLLTDMLSPAPVA